MGRLKDKLFGTSKESEEHYYEPEQVPEERYSEPYPEEYQQDEQTYTPEQRRQMEEYYRQQNEAYYAQQQDLERKEIDASAPLAILDEIKHRPSRKGTFPTVIQGKAVDLHALEAYVLKISPYIMRTILRYRTIRTMEEARNVAGRKPMKLNSKTLMLILLASGMAILGIIMIFFMPQIMQMFKGGI